MALKRKPPAGNIRRVAPIGNNLRYTITSKADETVQCESFQERKLTLLFDRDESVQGYRSQPERFAFTDSFGASRTYVPDFMVWRTTGEVEIHEVTLTERRDRFGIQEREKAARAICQQRGWRYIVHTEATLPQATEEANLLALYRYRPSIYANAAVTAALHQRLKGNERQAVHFLIPELAHALSLSEPTVISALCHLLWHCVIETDLTSGLLFVNADSHTICSDLAERKGEVRMKRTHRLPTPNTLQPGHYIFWQQRTYQVVTLDPDNALLLHVQPLAEGPRTMLSLLDLLSIPRTNPSAPLFAPTLEALHQQIEEQHGISQATTTHDLPDNYVIKARVVTSVVEMVRRMVSEDERRANMHGEAFSRKQAIQRALSTVNRTTIGMEVRGTRQDIQLHAGYTSYYKYEHLYETFHGDEAQIAASFRRSSFRLPRLSAAQFHFIDLCLLLYYGNTRSTKMRVYKLAQDILEKRTQRYWIDPERCGENIPENVVTELLDLKIPLQAILDNREKATLLTKIEMPSPAWFYAYTKYVEAQPDQGKAIITERLGTGIWEQFHLVFDTFVSCAQFPLQYVFADHWLLDAWIVDEETRQKPSRLWLTLLIDAYSRSILGMALLYEDPCIESIQQALNHAIWEKTSHLDLGLKQEWASYGIPLQLFLDNAWAHHSHSLENLARVLSRNGTYNSIDLVFRPPYKGRYGAIIERLFKNFSGQIKELVKGAIQSSDPKAVRTAAKEACLLYPDINRLLQQLILNYQHTPHGELHGMTPHQKWCDGIQSSGYPLVPPLSPAVERLFLRMHPQTRQVKRSGIPAFGLNYWSAELGGIERVGRDGKTIQYNFRYDPTNISRISLFRNGAWVGDGNAKELQQADGTYRQISLAEWKMMKHLVRSKDPSTEGKTPAELALVSDLQALSKQRTQEKKAAQRDGSKSSSPDTDEPRQQAVQATSQAPDVETERVLRFLHG